jgi:hypothetical protein
VNSYLFLHRIRGPVMILVFGITALLNQWGVLSFGESWPLYLIALGILQLAERAAWSQIQQGQYPGGPAGYPGNPTQPANWSGPSAPQPPSTSLTITPPDLPQDGGRR